MVIELGVSLPSGRTTGPEQISSVAEGALERGYRHVWAGEHLVTDHATADRGECLDPLDVLAWVAGRAPGVGIGTSVLLLPMRHPFHVAREAATLQLLSNGQFRLGIGVGWNDVEFRLAGYRFDDRGQRADEALRVITALWSGDTSFHGKFWSFDEAEFFPRPDPAPQIWVGGNSSSALARARRYADVWHPNGLPVEAIKALKKKWPGRVVPRVPIIFDRDSVAEEYAVCGTDSQIVAELNEALQRGG